MVALLLAAAMLAPLAQWIPLADPADPSGSRLPVVLFAAPSSTAHPGTVLDPDAAARRVVQGTAERLKNMGLSVEPGRQGEIVVTPDPGYIDASTERKAPRQASRPTGSTVTLAVYFPESPLPEASGTETRFGGPSDEAWRLASRVQRRMITGLRDVFAYDSFDRGVVEEDGGRSIVDTPQGVGGEDPWVAALPLFSSNAAEAALLGGADTLDLLSLALADAVSDYLSPGVPTPPRDARGGWRLHTAWQPLAPRLVVEVDDASKFALTFNSASFPTPLPVILKTLRENGIRCTIFLTGDFVDRYPDLVRQISRDGHEIGNHGNTHADLTTLTEAEIVVELEDLDAKIVALTGRSTRPWFRPASGAYNDQVVEVAAAQGYYTIYWTADSGDWRPELDSATVRQRIVRFAAPGAILVQHLTSSQSAEVLPDVLRQLKERGLQFGTISELLVGDN